MMPFVELTPGVAAILDWPQEISPPSADKSPEDFCTRQAQELAALGEKERAQRFDSCGELFQAILCKKHGHLKRVNNWKCMQRFCPVCAQVWAKDKIGKCEEPLARLVERTPEGEIQLFHAEVSFPCPILEAERVREFVDHFGEVIRELAEKCEVGEQSGLVGFRDGCLTIQAVVYLSDLAFSEEHLRSMWPDAKVKLSPIGKQDFKTILKSVLSPDLPKSPLVRARLEVACAGMHLGRAMGTFYTALAGAAKEDAEANTTQPAVAQSEPVQATSGEARPPNASSSASTRTDFPEPISEEHSCMGEETTYTRKSDATPKSQGAATAKSQEESTAKPHDPTTRHTKGTPCPVCGDLEEVASPWMTWIELTEFKAKLPKVRMQ